MNAPTFGSLFAGIGGIDLGLERAGWTCKWQVENNWYCLEVLRKHWPGVTRFGNIKRVNPSELEPVDLIAGGFPCQPTSTAGKRRGTEDPRWLWPEMHRIIRHLRPRFALVENPTGLYSKGFDQVLADLAESGYDAEWDCLPAAAFGAPHLRYRIFIIAYDHSKTIRLQPAGDSGSSSSSFAADDGEEIPLANADEDGFDKSHVPILRWGPLKANLDACRHGKDLAHVNSRGFNEIVGSIFPRQPNIARSSWWETEPSVGRVVDGVPFDMDRLAALGNAVIPQAAEWLGRRIIEMITPPTSTVESQGEGRP